MKNTNCKMLSAWLSIFHFWSEIIQVKPTAGEVLLLVLQVWGGGEGGSDFNTLLLISFSEAPYVLGNRDSRPPGYININIYKINFLHQKGLPICQSLIIMYIWCFYKYVDVNWCHNHLKLFWQSILRYLVDWVWAQRRMLLVGNI